MTTPEHSASPGRFPRNRSRVACQACNRRKVRCDVTQTGVPCSNCQYNAATCEVLPRKKHRPRATANSKHAKSSYQEQEDAVASDTQFLLPDDSPSSYIGDKRGPRYSVYDICHPGTPQSAPRRSSLLSSHFQSSNINWKPYEVEFIRSQGGFEALPPQEVSNEIVRCYFHHVHFLLPVVNAAEFLNEYTANGFRNISPLLIWCMFLAAANFLEENILHDAGFSSRKDMKIAMYTRAKCLYDLDHGTDKITLIQSVLLMGFWYTDPQDHTGAWYWIGVAITLAQSIGIHRDVGKSYNNVLSDELQPLTRRIWWSCVIRDRWLSLAKGRPMRIHDEDCDVPMPSLTDFSDEITQQVASQPWAEFIPAKSDVLSEMWLSLVKISAILGRIMRIHYRVKGPKPSIADVEQLATEIFQLETPRLHTSDDLVLIHNYHLEIFCRATVVILYRPYALHLEAELPTGADALWQRTAQMHARSAASTTNTTLERLIEIDALKYVKPMIITALIPTMQIHLSDYRSGNSLQKDLARNKLQLCMLFLANIRDTYWSADVMYRLFDRAQTILSPDSSNKTENSQIYRSSNSQQFNNCQNDTISSDKSNNGPTTGETVVNVFRNTASPSFMPNVLLEGGGGGGGPQSFPPSSNNGHAYLGSSATIDQLLNPEFSLPDDGSSSLFPFFAFDNEDHGQLGNRMPPNVQIDLFLGQSNH